MSIINPSKHLYSGLVTSRCTHVAHFLRPAGRSSTENGVLKSRKKHFLAAAATESTVLSNKSIEISLNLENELIIF